MKAKIINSPINLFQNLQRFQDKTLQCNSEAKFRFRKFLTSLSFSCSCNYLTKLVPYRWWGGGLLVCPSITLKFYRLSLSSFEILIWNLVNMILKLGISICHYIIQIKFEFCQAWPTFTGSYWRLLKFSFPEFSQSSFEILTWHLVYEFLIR